MAFSIVVRSSGESSTWSALRDSSSWVRVRAPSTGIIFSPLASTQAMANCAELIPLSAASLRQRSDEPLIVNKIVSHKSRKLIAHIASARGL